MRLTGLLALLLFILILFFAAPAASYAQSVLTPSRPMVKSDALPSLNALVDLARRVRYGSEFERDGVCYTMRTYVMAREDKDSDATRMVRATRCLPASKIEFKTTVEPVRRAEEADPTQR